MILCIVLEGLWYWRRYDKSRLDQGDYCRYECTKRALNYLDLLITMELRMDITLLFLMEFLGFAVAVKLVLFDAFLRSVLLVFEPEALTVEEVFHLTGLHCMPYDYLKNGKYSIHKLRCVIFLNSWYKFCTQIYSGVLDHQNWIFYALYMCCI